MSDYFSHFFTTSIWNLPYCGNICIIDGSTLSALLAPLIPIACMYLQFQCVKPMITQLVFTAVSSLKAHYIYLRSRMIFVSIFC